MRNTEETPKHGQRTLFRVPSDKLWYIAVNLGLRTVLKKNSKVILVRKYWMSRCAYSFHSLKLLQLELQLQKKLNNGLVFLKFPLQYLLVKLFLQECDKWLLGLRSLLRHFLTVTHFSKCDPCFQVWPICPSVTHFPSVTHVSKCDPFVPVWPMFPSVTHLSQCDPFS